MNMFNTASTMMNLTALSSAETRSISAENFNGAKGGGGMATEGISKECARDLGPGWKVSPAIAMKPHSTAALAEIEGPGVIQHIWITCAPEFWRSLILRFYWDGEAQPSVEVPVGDFFCNGWCERSNVTSFPVAVLPAGGMNSYWAMPFRKSAAITLENISDKEIPQFFYQITYSLTDVADNCAYFHAQWRRNNPLKYKEVHTILDNVSGSGHYVGTYMAWQSNSGGWWGEGEVKFYMDGDKEYPTICGTGTEDYFGGAWAFSEDGSKYATYSSNYLGFHQVIEPNSIWRSQTRFGMYRWHVMDPIRFHKDLRVTMQALGWRSEMRYLPLQDDIASTAFWYQTEPHMPYATNLDKDHLEVI